MKEIMKILGTAAMIALLVFTCQRRQEDKRKKSLTTIDSVEVVIPKSLKLTDLQIRELEVYGQTSKTLYLETMDKVLPMTIGRWESVEKFFINKEGEIEKSVSSWHKETSKVSLKYNLLLFLLPMIMLYLVTLLNKKLGESNISLIFYYLLLLITIIVAINFKSFLLTIFFVWAFVGSIALFTASYLGVVTSLLGFLPVSIILTKLAKNYEIASKIESTPLVNWEYVLLFLVLCSLCAIIKELALSAERLRKINGK